MYQKYLGWYDGNPTNLNALSPSKRSEKFLSYFNDLDDVLDKAERDFEKGEYQWVSEITNLIVFGDPSNTRARTLCADSLEQLAYQTENGSWRNAYLMGAKELRYGVEQSKELAEQAFKGTVDILKNITIDMTLDYWAIMIDSKAAEDINVSFNLLFENKEVYSVQIVSGVVLYQKDVKEEHPDATIYLQQDQLIPLLMSGQVASDLVKIEGNQNILTEINKHRTNFELFFNIVEP